jgi:hypothetical protein
MQQVQLLDVLDQVFGVLVDSGEDTLSSESEE